MMVVVAVVVVVIPIVAHIRRKVDEVLIIMKLGKEKTVLVVDQDVIVMVATDI